MGHDELESLGILLSSSTGSTNLMIGSAVQPLAAMNVLDLGNMIAAPFRARILAEPRY
jgi:hypothetical protein